MGGVDLWPLIAGLGFFMFGMKQLEEALKVLAGASFRRFLRAHANTPVKGVITGTLATTVLQSSSLVSLLILAFVGAGIIELRAAIGVIMGANLGTTVTGWLVATLGFKFSIGALSLGMVGLGGFGSALLQQGSRLQQLASLVVGLGLLLFGLDMMKSGVETFATRFDVSPFAGWSVLALAGLGALVTAVIQSSSAAMMIALSALYGGILAIEAAAAFAIGTGVGTTVTAVIGSLGGAPDKKRVAAAHVGYNLIKAVAALFFLHPLLAVLAWIPALDDPLLRLVAFHSAFNVIGIVLMLPFIGVAARWLETRFVGSDAPINRYLHGTGSDVPEVAAEAVEKEAHRVLCMAVGLNRYVMRLHPDANSKWLDLADAMGREGRRSYGQRYERLKRLEGELIEYVLSLQQKPLSAALALRLSRQLETVRMAVLSAKSVKDIRENLVELRLGMRPAVEHWLQRFDEAHGRFYREIERLDAERPAAMLVEEITRIHHDMRDFRDQMLHDLYHATGRARLRELELSTFLNVNRELHTSIKLLLRAMQSHLLHPETVDVLNAAQA